MIYNWRSLLFVPVNNPKHLSKVKKTAPDAVILDLEDGVLEAAKPEARQELHAATKLIKADSIPIVVRVNSGWQDLMADLSVAIHPSINAIMLPKVETAAHVSVISEIITEFEVQRNMSVGHTRIIALIETPLGLQHIAQIVALDRVCGLALGTEDFCLNLGVKPVPHVLDLPARQIALAAASQNKMALAVPISIAEFRDIEAYTKAALRASEFGVTGAICIHPAQISAANNCFQPSMDSIDQARKIMEAWNTAQENGQAVTSLDGAMIDLPVAVRAKALLAKLP